jgi:hypothetical protein
MHIVSNQMGFNPTTQVCDHFVGNLIHVFNKNESSVPEGKHKDMITDRPNVILLGDSLGDLQMAEGIRHDTKLTIGFLNHDKEVLLEEYGGAFDLVITEDSSLELVNLILKSLG